MSLAPRSVRSARRLVAPLVLVTTAALAGCGSDAPTAPGGAPLDVAGLATAMANVPGLRYAALQDPAGTAFGMATVLPDRNCAWSDAGQRFDCAPVTLPNGLRVVAAWVALDAAGQPLRTPTAGTTAAFRTTSLVTGTFQAPPVAGAPTLPAITLAASSDQTLSGLRTGLRRLDGTSTTTTSIAGLGVGGAPIVTETRTTIVGLLLPTGNARWPQGGTITTRTVTGDAAVEQVMTFDGTSRVAIVFRGAGPERRCTLDLERPTSDALLACLTGA